MTKAIVHELDEILMLASKETKEILKGEIEELSKEGQNRIVRTVKYLLQDQLCFLVNVEKKRESMKKFRIMDQEEMGAADTLN